jgi:hypothetical protein
MRISDRQKGRIFRQFIVFLIIPYKFLSLDGRGLRACPEFNEG